MSPLSDRELAARLIGFDSVSRNSNLPIADFVCSYLDQRGVRIDRIPGPGEGKVTVVASKGPAPDDRSGLVLSGHLDVVPADEPDWESDPFTLTEREGRLYGRGSSDMKGPIALMMNAFASSDPDSLMAPLVLILTPDEELGCLGVQHFCREWPKDRVLPRAGVIGEPTEMKVVRMHKGHLSAMLTVTGRSAHSGSPHLGINAIEPAARIIAELAPLRVELEAMRVETSPFFPQTPFPVLNIAQIEGGKAINIVPASCIVRMGVRLLPGMDAAPLVERMRAIVESAGCEIPTRFEVLNETPALLTGETAAIHIDLCGALGQQGSAGVNYASDGGPFNRDLGMECVLFGPGSIDVAHRPNEYIPIDQLSAARPVYDDLIRRWCHRA